MNSNETDTLIEQETGVETRKKLRYQVIEEGQVTVHCKLSASFVSSVARIWPSTFLIDKVANHNSRLILLEGITKYPVWTEIQAGTTLYFTLVFSPLPRSCMSFDFL